MQMSEEDICQIQSGKDDRRNKFISLTEKGLTLVNQIHIEAEAQVKQALGMMNEEEKNIVANGLSMYADALRKSSLQHEYTSGKSSKRGIQ
jgi:DNA-binding MarR family transcriptional regulator